MIWIGRVAAALVILLVALAAWGYGEATRDPVVVQYRVTLADWPAGAPPLRIVQLSDVHFGWPDMPAARIARIVAQANALHPDLIVITGDLMGGKLWDRDVGNMDEAVRPLKGLHARYGVFAARGNHDGPYWTPIVLGRTAIHLLQDRWVEIGPVVLAGVDDITGRRNPLTAPVRAIAGAPEGKPVILLAHEPDFFQWLPRGVDLMIAGHTHGGQIVLPVCGWRSMGDYYDAHRRGLFAEHRQQLVVSSGLGTSVVPLRIGVPPELAVITVGPGYSVGRKSGTDR